jgi:hypothetical protein
MTIFCIIIMVVAIMLVLIKSTPMSAAPHQEIVIETVDDEEGDLIDGSFLTYIAGINHHCSASDIGGFTGVVAPEPTNQYDKNAVAIYRSDSKLLGYISKSELSEYHEWSRGKPFTCVGYITGGNNAPLKGRVKIIKPYNEQFVKKETDEYIQWMVNKFEKNFLPK